MTRRAIIPGIAFCMAITSVGRADEGVIPVRPPHHNGVQVGVLELLWREYSVKYEHLFGTRDALEVEGSIIDSPSGSGYTLGVGYRRHRPGQFSGRFWGPFLTFKDFEDEYEEKVDGETLTHPYSVRGAVVGLNIGHRWIWNPGFSGVLRFGYGVPLVDLVWERPGPSDHPDAIKGLLTFMQGFDAEVSVGYCF
ncbi:MAG: hypothetical protein MUE60_06145 [Candidatus Eisenbacteria bacterium]|nr:hypothetical protein [Candidatus Eisenbacteria bacterium]